MGSMHDNWTWSLSCTGHSLCTARMSHAPACIHVVSGPISHRSGISRLWGHWFAILGCALQWLAGGCLAPCHTDPFHIDAPRHTGLELEPWGSFALDSGCALQWSAGGRPRQRLSAIILQASLVRMRPSWYSFRMHCRVGLGHSRDWPTGCV